MTGWSGPLPPPVLVEPPDCACRGQAPQMREHTRTCCSVLTTAELNYLTAALPMLARLDDEDDE